MPVVREPQNHANTITGGTSPLTLNDSAGNPMVKFTSVGSGVTRSGSMTLYGGTGQGDAKEAWIINVDIANVTSPYQDFVISKNKAAGAVSDTDGIYIENGGAGVSATGIGVAQPKTNYAAARLVVKGAATDLTQGGLRIPINASQTGIPLKVDSLTSTGFQVGVNGETAVVSSQATAFSVTTTGGSTLLNIDGTSAGVAQMKVGTLSVGPGALASNPGNATLDVIQSASADATFRLRSGGGNGMLATMSNTAATGVSFQTTNASAMKLGTNSVTMIAIGTNAAAGSKTLGFYGVTPVVQQVRPTDAASIIAAGTALGIWA